MERNGWSVCLGAICPRRALIKSMFSKGTDPKPARSEVEGRHKGCKINAGFCDLFTDGFLEAVQWLGFR
jgi:hypothetical protein